MEIALVRAAQASPSLVNPMEEAVLRTALSLARLYRLRHEGRDVGVGAFLEPFREDVTRRLSPLLLAKRPPRRDELAPHLNELREITLRTRDELLRRMKDRVAPDVIHREIRQKSLVLVSGGGGGTGYVYLGVMAMLEEFGIRPSLLVGTSIGAILSLFRSRIPHFDYTDIVNIVRTLSWKKLFRAVSTESRWGLPAALRLYLRAGIGRYFGDVRLKELPIPTIVSVSGIRRDMLPHPIEFYERLLRVTPSALLDPGSVARGMQAGLSTLAEFFSRPEMLVKLHLGLDADTGEFDALDAAGFSSALPGVIHYDVLREDQRMSELLGDLFAQRGISRLVDGGLVDNVPAKAAWKAVHKGKIGTRNAFILALDGFSPRLATPLWLPLQRLAAITVRPNVPYAHLMKHFQRTLSPLELVPTVEAVAKAMELGRKQFANELPFLSRMLAPLPAL